MTLQFFESFNTHARINAGLDGGGDQDMAPEFTGSTFNRHQYVDGPTGYGQAVRVREYTTFAFDKFLTAEYSRIVVGGHFKLVGPNPSWNVEQRFFENIGTAGNTIQFSLNSNGDCQLRYNGVNQGTAVTALLSLTDWNYIIVDVNSATGLVTIKKNGVQVLSETVAMTEFTTAVSHGITIGRITVGVDVVRNDICMDNFWVANEPPTDTGEELMGVMISSTQDRFTASAQGLLGTVIIDGLRYEQQYIGAGISSQTYGDLNVANTIHHFYPVDPSTGDSWTDASFARVSHWGVCYDNTNGTYPGNDVRLVALALQKLMYNDGQPVVEVIKPGPAAYFSGPWRKTHPELAFFAHVNKHPRDDSENYDDPDVTSLYINDIGCMLFLSTQSYDPEPLETIGITFAEEKRIDYADWCLVVGGVGFNYDSWLISGYSLAGQGDKFFSSNYLTINFANVDNGQAYAQGVWDYANANDTSRWSMRQMIYGPSRVTSGNYTHGSRKLLMRGQGRALQVRLSSKAGNAFRINGWTMYITGNSKA
jgi:hypothetical protein